MFSVLVTSATADRTDKLGDTRAIQAQTVGEVVAEVTSTENKSVLLGLDEVGGDEIPTKGAGTGDDERLGGGVSGLEQLANLRQSVAKG